MNDVMRKLPGEKEELQPPPAYAVPIVLLVAAVILAGMNIHSIVTKGEIEVVSLFIIPGAFLLGIIGVIDPRVPNSIRPNSHGYPRHMKIIANGCWVISLVVGGLLYYFLVA